MEIELPKNRKFLGLAVGLLLAVSSTVLADETRVVRVTFKDGHASIKGRLKGYETVDYVFPAGAGESIRIHFDGDKRLSNYFNLSAPGATEPLHIGSSAGDDFDGVAKTAGDYTARVYLMRNDARRKKIANYTLTIDVGKKSATNEKGPDFADGLTGGPDYWEVTGAPTGDRLNLRETATPDGKIVIGVGNGEILKNGGCKNTQGQRWRRVSTKRGDQGWANGAYLREGAGPR